MAAAGRISHISRLFSPTYAARMNAQIVYPASSTVVKPNELASALARPVMTATYEPERPLTYLAATLAYGIIQGHPFFDGNKRTANELMRAYGVPGLVEPEENGLTTEALHELADRHVNVAQGNLGVDGLAYAELNQRSRLPEGCALAGANALSRKAGCSERSR
ncbi:hypothetical protein PUNSTDRAFT_97372 [Punctularia strigosozonata HHB-11173 SS5]|uniref:uncharacterized protein n=1 Tax=Punctularia strigosozonata (strain HHB-11173) TaxID=741275 RepID=UPI000441681D|nr:uncharacterized protein PUNSTDRAFT_97372 [Punctularia strigosozonata HHB-11173 SS5]EIN12587.1 hypothetical protein PUNSTDRAFT_97372 [Punctularia strigosozonata HHB-11173 SS5]